MVFKVGDRVKTTTGFVGEVESLVDGHGIYVRYDDGYDLGGPWHIHELTLLQEEEVVSPREALLRGAPSPREELLLGAIEAVTKQRNNQYGPPTQDFDRTAGLWNYLFGGKGSTGEAFTAHDVAMAMAALKLSRLTWDPTNQDSWLDLAGYAACGYECVEKENE
jgi:hypothetical protein